MAASEGYVAMDSHGGDELQVHNAAQQVRRRAATSAGNGNGTGKRWGPNGPARDGSTTPPRDGGHMQANGLQRRWGSTEDVKPAHERSNSSGVGPSPAVTNDSAGAERSQGPGNQSFAKYGGGRTRASTTAGSSGHNHGHHGHGHGHGRNGHHAHGASTDDTSAAGGGAAASDEHLDAPLLAEDPSVSQAPSAGGAVAVQHRRRSSRISSSGDGASQDGGDGAAGHPSKAREVVEKIKEGTWSVAAEVLDLMPNKVASKVVKEIPHGVLMRLLEMQDAMLTGFTHDNAAHQELIPLLWQALERLRPPLPIAGDMDKTTWRSELWKDYGFQGMDPATDLRGAGVLGIRSVIWMCAEEPDISRAMLDGGYPFAIAVINVVMALLNLLHMTRGKKTCLDTKIETANYTAQEARMRLSVIVGSWQCACPTSAMPLPPRGPTMSAEVIASCEDGFMNVAAEACRVLHGEWLRSKRNVMEFNSVLKTAMSKFERLIRDKETYTRLSRAVDARYPEAPLSCAGI